MKIQYYTNKKDNKGFEVELKEVIENIKTGGKHKDRCELMRTIENKTERDKHKDFLPAVAFAGTFTHRNKQSLKESSGLMILDYDASYNDEETDKIRKKLENDSHVYLVFKSPSGALKYVIKTPKIENDEEFKQHYFSILDYFNSKGVVLDESGKDVCRLCYMSYDEEIYVNEDSKPYENKISKEELNIRLNTTKKSKEKEIKQEKLPEGKCPSYCKLIEKYVISNEFESKNGYTKHNYIDPMVYVYSKLNNKPKILSNYMLTHGRDKGTFNDADKYEFTCGMLKTFFDGTGMKGKLTYCNACPEHERYIEEKERERIKEIGKYLDVCSFEELLAQDIKPVDWKIDNLLAEEGITIIGGDSGVGKSWLALYLSLKLSNGHRILETFNSKKSKVLYIDEENGERAMFTRTNMLRPFFSLKEEEIDFSNIYFSNRNSVKLDKGRRVEEDTGYNKFKYLIQTYQPEVCVIDSFVRFFNGEENSSSDVSKVYDTLKWAMKEYKTSFILLHHTTKNGNGKGTYNKHTLRGSGDLAAQCDNVLMCTKILGSPNIRVEQLKNRHEKELDMPFNIKMEENDGIFSIAYGGNIQTEKESNLDGNIRLVCNIIADNEWVQFRTANVLSQYKSRGGNKDSLSFVLKRLVSEKILKKPKQGLYDVLSEFHVYYERLQESE